jgi:hypothetical protein
MFLHPTANAEELACGSEAWRRRLAESASSLYTTKVFRSSSFQVHFEFILRKAARLADARPATMRLHAKVRLRSVCGNHHLHISVSIAPSLRRA